MSLKRLLRFNLSGIPSYLPFPSQKEDYFCAMERIFSLEEIQKVATEFWRHAGNSKVFAFHGNLGAGKTTLISALCREKGVKDTTSSPTFALINDYIYKDDSGMNRHIFHLDLYRIKDEEEAVQAGIEDCLYSGSVCMVEWAEKIPDLLPEGTVHITITPVEDGRKLVME